MSSLQTVRVIIVDDDPKDGEAIARALWRLRIPPLYFRGIDDVLPDDQRLRGVRLAILDMDLYGVGAATDVRTQMAALVGTLDGILAPDNGPYAVIAWTLHTELVAEFEKYLHAPHVTTPRPVHILPLDKTAYKSGDDYDLEKMLPLLDQHLNQYSGLLFLRAWEQQSFAATAQLTSDFAALAHPDQADLPPADWRKQWDVNLRQLACALASAVAGESALDSGSTAARAFFSGLAPLHADRLEATLESTTAAVQPHCDSLVAEDTKSALPTEKYARINTMLHCSFDDLNTFRAGNVYLETAHPELLDSNALKETFFQVEPVRDKPKQTFIQRKTALLPDMIPIYVECNAECDHIQCKVRLARLVPGVLLPIVDDTIKATLTNAAYHWRLGPLRLKVGERAPADYYLVLNFLFLHGVPIGTFTGKSALLRLRHEAFADLQVRLGDHASRPGKTELSSPSP